MTRNCLKLRDWDWELFERSRPPRKHGWAVENETYVYFGYDPNAHQIKIGYSIDPRGRLKLLRLELVLLLRVPSEYRARDLESELHFKFRKLRIEREFFAVAPDIIRFIAECWSGAIKEIWFPQRPAYAAFEDGKAHIAQVVGTA